MGGQSRFALVLLACIFLPSVLQWLRRRSLKRHLQDEKKTTKTVELKPPQTMIAAPKSGTKVTKPISSTAKLPKLQILYATQTGTALRFARDLKRMWNKAARFDSTTIIDLASYEPENLFDLGVNAAAAADTVVVFIMSTAHGGTPTDSAKAFMDWLKDISVDFRRSKSVLSTLAGVAVYGIGSTEYPDEYFCTPAKECATFLTSLGATPVDVAFPGCGDDTSKDMDATFTTWCATLLAECSNHAYEYPDASVGARVVAKTAPKTKKKTNWGNNKAEKLPDENEEDKLNDFFVDADTVDDSMLDIEDMGSEIAKQKKQVSKDKSSKTPREMVTPRQAASLKKEGYKLIGTHSAVKLCRWTKNQLRGRGGCYKHTCYGITSYQCMEATPSLACANKCTFCWRHHKNPVGTSWRWKEDDPAMIVREAIALHDQMVREMKGVPGVEAERLREAARVRHCALSLVGEPIMYPQINTLLDELHQREISTFLVTNAQFPECIDSLSPLTQLYVSVDAATKESLRAVDRPLFKDFWERFQASLVSLRHKKQRTVYRLTLLKGENMDDIEAYAALVKLGQPDFIEVKSVTFCGTSDASSLTFENVPFHAEVVEFCEKMCEHVNECVRRRKREAEKSGIDYGEDAFCEYAIASEHQHSNLVLIAKKSYMKNGQWHTWIDYPKYHQLWSEWKASGGKKTFTSQDYLAPTPHWACYGAPERGMDPLENRKYHNRTIRRAKEGLLSKEQLAQYPSNPAEQEPGQAHSRARKHAGSTGSTASTASTSVW